MGLAPRARKTRSRSATVARKSLQKVDRNLFEDAPAPYLIVASDGIIKKANRRAAKLLWSSVKDLVGSSVLDLYVNKDVAQSVFAKFISGEEVIDREVEMRTAKGNLIWVSVTVLPIKNDQGVVVESRSMLLDITPRKVAEEERTRLRLLLDEANDAIFVADPGTGRFLDVNQTACRLLGYTREELLKMSPEVGFSLSKAEWNALMENLRIAGSMVFEGVHRRKNGKTFPVEVSLVMKTIAGEEYQLAVVRDITERKRLEKDLIEADHREQLRIGIDLHDNLGQHLTGISLLLAGLEKRLEKTGLEYVDEVKRILDLVNQANVQTRNLAHVLSPVGNAPDSLVSSLRTLSISVEDMYGVNCRFSDSGKIFIRDRSKTTHLYRIVQEAIHNAVHHGKPDRIDVGLTHEGEVLSVSVRDDGRGFNPERPQGDGMGLAIMRFRARAIGANLDIHSINQDGTTVTVTLKANL